MVVTKRKMPEQERDLMKYEVIHYFTDLQDFDHPYRVGDIFPRSGMKVSEGRLKELSGSNNKQHKPLIKAVEDEPLPFSDDDITLEEKEEETEEKKKEERQYTKLEISRMKKAELLEIAISTGVEGAEDMSRAELVEYLLSVFGL